jgi:hypothetical protein
MPSNCDIYCCEIFGEHYQLITNAISIIHRGRKAVSFEAMANCLIDKDRCRRGPV